MNKIAANYHFDVEAMVNYIIHEYRVESLV